MNRGFCLWNSCVMCFVSYGLLMVVAVVVVTAAMLFIPGGFQKGHFPGVGHSIALWLPLPPAQFILAFVLWLPVLLVFVYKFLGGGQKHVAGGSVVASDCETFWASPAVRSVTTDQTSTCYAAAGLLCFGATVSAWPSPGLGPWWRVGTLAIPAQLLLEQGGEYSLVPTQVEPTRVQSDSEVVSSDSISISATLLALLHCACQLQFPFLQSPNNENRL